LTKWVGEAWELVHKHYKSAIIKTFQNVGLSLNPDGSQDHLLSIRDLPNITIGNWQQAPEGIVENLAIIDDTIEVDEEEGLLYTAQEIEQGVAIKAENEADITTDSGDESNVRFDYDSKSESNFDDDVDGDEDVEDEDME
jgi:hypothetical protein